MQDEEHFMLGKEVEKKQRKTPKKAEIRAHEKMERERTASDYNEHTLKDFSISDIVPFHFHWGSRSRFFEKFCFHPCFPSTLILHLTQQVKHL